ncbi:protein shisa-5-like [Cheilinus undulatus]|uniref:protein shisa-5-like n=1 Tax=Cheilinus undulatus TaxID=241271 RepID=UPI001BD313CE|nr:protein shisa-5-like [Cheilinus undulatus]
MSGRYFSRVILCLNRRSLQQPLLVPILPSSRRLVLPVSCLEEEKAAMASGLPCVVVLALCIFLLPSVSVGSPNCDSYRDGAGVYHVSQTCYIGYCCGSCYNRYCCQNSFLRLTEDEQDECDSKFYMSDSPLPMVFGIGTFVAILLIFICCCVCPCCCLYKMCRKPRPVIATTTHTTVVTSTPQHYPQQPTATPVQSYQGGQYPPYQPVPAQGYGPQPMPQGYGAQPYHGQPFAAGPPPTYQEATGPGYPPNPMPYSQAAYNPGGPAYPSQPPIQPKPMAPSAHTDYLAQPAYNPDYVAPPP